MALANWAAFRTMMQSQYEFSTRQTTSGQVIPAQCYTFLHTFPTVGGTNPTTAVAPDSTTAGALKRRVSSSQGVIAAGQWADSPNQRLALVVDRLSHSGGISGVNAGVAQTTNLPTAALTRYTSGEGVLAAIQCNNFGGGQNAHTISVSYTNTASTAGQVGTVVTANVTAFGTGCSPFSLAAGDTGVKSVESVTWSAVGIAGPWQVVLFKPIAWLPFNNMGQRIEAPIIPGWNNLIDTGACLELWWVYYPGASFVGTTQEQFSLGYGEI